MTTDTTDPLRQSVTDFQYEMTMASRALEHNDEKFAAGVLWAFAERLRAILEGETE